MLEKKCSVFMGASIEWIRKRLKDGLEKKLSPIYGCHYR